MSTRTVLHFSDACGFGGTERMLLATLAELDRQRWHPVLMHHDHPAAMRLAEEAQRLDVETCVVPGVSGRLLTGLGEMPDLVRRIRAHRPAIVHAHLPWALRCTKALIAARLAGAPGVIATQQLFVALRSRHARLKHRAVALGVDRYIAVSREMATAMRAVVPGEGRIEVIPNAIDPAEFMRSPSRAVRAALTRGRAAPVVLTIARLHWQKGLGHLLRAAALVPDAIFVVAGDGELRETLEQDARALGIFDRLRLLGERADIAELLASADLFVLSSVVEGFPVSVLEAMAAGCPVVASDIPGTREIVRHGVTGMLVPSQDPETLAQTIRLLLADPDLARRLARTAREDVVREHSVSAMVDRVARVYDEVLSGRRAAA